MPKLNSTQALIAEAQRVSSRPRDHVCGGGIPDCAACCVDLPGIPGNCLEVSRTDCVLTYGGNPQAQGSDCHDFNGNGSADECEPSFPFCTATPNGSACEGACPGPLPCNPTKVRVNLATFSVEILECGCRFCRVCVECDAFPPPCADDCPNNEVCVRSEQCYSPDICDISCDCGPPIEACCLPMADITCHDLLPTDCQAFGGTPQGPGSSCLGHEACCLPDDSCTFVDRICCEGLGGTALGAGTTCEGVGTCCYDVTDDLCLFDTCLEQDGACCAAAGGFFQGIGSDCGIEACCIGGGLCCMMDADCCAISGGVAAGPGTSCAGEQGACCYDGDGDFIPDVCIVTDATCCADVGGSFHGPGSTCSPNFGACCFGFTGGGCVELNESCCGDLEAGTFLGNGSVCLGDGNGNGFDDACEANACVPDSVGQSCLGQCLPNEACRPERIRRELTGDHRIAECDCTPLGQTCHVDFSPANPILGQPVCVGVCPPGQLCDLVSTGNLDGTVDYHCVCHDENLPLPCGPNTGGDACVGACSPDRACIPTVVRRDPLNPGLEAALSCDCWDPYLCRTALDNSGAPSCPGYCPGPIACNPHGVPTPAFQEFLQCACFTEACCFATGFCQNLPPELCRVAGGLPSGPGTLCRLYGDLVPKPAGDGVIDVDDILKMLAAFIDPAAYPNGDIFPCGGNGVIDADDLLAELDAFKGIYACADGSCP